MKIRVRHAAPMRRWHCRLGERLAEAGHEVMFEAISRGASGRWLPAVERRLYGVDPDWDATCPAPSNGPFAVEATIVLDGDVPATGLVALLEIAGRHGEAGLLAAARGGAAPLVRVLGGPADAMRLLAVGRPAIEDPAVCARALETLLPRLVTLLVQAVERLGSDGEATPLSEGAAGSPPGVVAFFARGLLAKLRHRLGPNRGRPDHWRLAFRRTDENDWRALPDEPSRFLADPFVVEDGGREWVFFEDFCYGDAKGVIGCGALAPEDVRSPAGLEQRRTALEEPFHLSYPLALRHRGAIYMLPEAAQSGRLRLYRADPFPHRWTPDAVLLDGSFGDATPILHEGRWWLFATAFDDGGSSWDQLHIFHAPDLLGPWTPHKGNPVMVDAGAARPAGMMWHENGTLYRPAQDCRTGYGTAVVLCRVDRLDEAGFQQTQVGRMEPPDGAAGLHTFNRLGGWEIVDLKVPRSRG